MNKRRFIVYSVSALIMTGIFTSTFFIELDNTISLFDILTRTLFPWMVGKYIAKLANRFTDWLLKTEE